MLVLLLLYFIGKAFYKLAEKYGRSKWLFAIIGVASYYAGSFIAGIIIVIAMEQIEPGQTDTMNDYLLSFIALPFSLLACWGLHKVLEKQWQKNVLAYHPESLDADLIRPKRIED